MTVSTLALLPSFRSALAASAAAHRLASPGCRDSLGVLPVRHHGVIRARVEITRTARCGRCGVVLAHVRRGLAEVAA
jgi:hypothetical protein